MTGNRQPSDLTHQIWPSKL